jgi:hypothetical protein
MDVSRAQGITDVMKNITGLGKAIKKPSTLKYIASGESRLPEAVAGSQVIRILMIAVASLLLIGIILLCVDQWVTPIFQRAPGDNGYIPVPGIDPSELFWLNSKGVADITVGSTVAETAGTKALSTNVIENQGNYSITMDVLIKDEYPQALGNDVNGRPMTQRTFFLLGPQVSDPTLQVSIDNMTNTCIITLVDSDKKRQSIEIDNVPIHIPFRIGISKSPYIMEGYLNGLLVKTRQLKTSTRLPSTGDKIYSPANIVINTNVVSQGIKVRNVRCFGYTVPSSEMKGRMNDGLMNRSIWSV